ncbi:MAG: hypothetical protein WDN24_20650 [Sphingomonas sp.]
MGLVQINVAEVAELGTQVAMHGAMRAGEVLVDDIFELIVGIVGLIIELAPDL